MEGGAREKAGRGPSAQAPSNWKKKFEGLPCARFEEKRGRNAEPSDEPVAHSVVLCRHHKTMIYAPHPPRCAC